MIEQWLNLVDIPATGREFSFHDAQAWAGLWNEFNMDCREDTPLTLTLEVLPQPTGYLLRGVLQGRVIMACSRCLQDARVDIDVPFDIFEAFPKNPEDMDEDSFLRSTDGTWELDIAGLMWEQFVLGLPEQQLCSSTCRGICPGCGRNLNEEECVCEQPAPPSGLAALQGLKIPSKK
jgi:uncharacterized protein